MKKLLILTTLSVPLLIITQCRKDASVDASEGLVQNARQFFEKPCVTLDVGNWLVFMIGSWQPGEKRVKKLFFRSPK